MWGAEQMARTSDVPNRHGCVVAKGSKFIAAGFNKAKTHPAAAHTLSGRIHAELAAILSAKAAELHGADLYSCRVLRAQDERRGMARPCRECMKLIRAAKIKRVYFTNANGEMEVMKV